MAVISEADGHLSARQILARLQLHSPTTAFSTVYRTLQRLEDLGVVHALAVGDEVLYGLADEAHHHAVCTSCGQIEHLPASLIATAITAIEGVSGMHVRSTAGVTVTGTCASCTH